MFESAGGGPHPEQDFPKIAEAYINRDLNLDELATSRISLHEINDGFAALKHGKTITTVIQL